MGKYVAKLPNSAGFIDYTAEENETWQILIDRQNQTIQGRACQAFHEGLVLLGMPTDRVPQCHEVSKKLMECTGWQVESVAAIISLQEFFQLLANRKFPAATFIRIREELDYLQEPDIFHEFYGHCPLITNQAYADYLEWYGRFALKADKHGRELLGRLFWFTVEFGLLQTEQGIQIYGGGILSSNEETVYALESDQPEHIPFDLDLVLQTEYRYDEIQKCYFVLDSLDRLYDLRDDALLTDAIERHRKDKQDDSFIIC